LRTFVAGLDMKRQHPFLKMRVAALICAGILIALLIRLYFRPLWTPEGFDRIKEGMTLSEVESLLGAPPGDYCLQRCEMLAGSRTKRPAPVHLRELVWFDECHRFEIYFDADDRVVATNERQQWRRPPPPNWLDHVVALMR
jgi:hypothetical protein